MKSAFVSVTLLCLVACGAPAPVLPLQAGSPPPAEVTLVWVGEGKAEILQGGVWQRAPEFDYQFSVVQRRYRNHWDSVKELHRRHPNYDGSAGQRDQTYFFHVAYRPADDESAVSGSVTSTLGNGSLSTDRGFRDAVVELDADVSSFAPFNAYRITQHYRYDAGSLTETVELNKKHDGTETPWVRSQEQATLFAPHRFEAPPTQR